MKNIFVFALFVPFISINGYALSSGLSYPKIFIEYASSLDLQACPSGISPMVLQEAQRKIPELQNLWRSHEKALLGTTTTVVGKSFLRHEETVSTFICPKLKGQAEPILIPMWPFLASTTQKHPFDLTLFIGITFHELLHRYVDKILGGMMPSTPLLAKYSNETILVRRHLHVDAIQKIVYLRLGRTNEINAIIENDSKSLGPDYARAWEIVNRIEGSDSFLKELK